MHILLGLVKSQDVVYGISPKAFLAFLMTDNSLVKMGLVGDKEILLALLPKTTGREM
jgi:hypothetical protein